MILRAAAGALALVVCTSTATAVAGGTPPPKPAPAQARVPAGRQVPPPPPHTVPATGDVPLASLGVTLKMPAVSGWQLTADREVGEDVLTGPASELHVMKNAVTCAQWAGTASAPAWAPGTFWPRVRASPHGAALCVQRTDDAALVIVSSAATPPDADTRAVLTAVADALRPPTAVLEGLPPLRLPIPVSADGPDKWTGFDGVDHFDFTVAVQRTACALASVASTATAANTGELAESAAGPPWLPARVDYPDHQYLCAELHGTSVVVTWPTAALLERDAVLRAIGDAALATFGPATTNAGGTVTILGKPTHLDPATAGAWKIEGDADTAVLTALDGDTAFEIHVARTGACPVGEKMPPERSQGFAPPALQPIASELSRTSPPVLTLTSCLRVGQVTPLIEVRSRSAAAEPPSGAAAVKVRAALVAVASVFVGDPELGVGKAPSGPAPRARAPVVVYRTDVAVWGGLLTQTAKGTDADLGALFGGDLRAAPKAGLGLAAALDGEVGYGSGADGEVRGGLGLGVGIGALAVQALAGYRAGSIGRIGTGAAHVQIGATLDLHSVIASAAVLQEFLGTGDVERRFDFRLAYAPAGKRGTICAGVQVGQVVSDDAGNRDAIVVYLGLGFTSGHDAGPAEAPIDAFAER